MHATQLHVACFVLPAACCMLSAVRCDMNRVSPACVSCAARCVSCVVAAAAGADAILSSGGTPAVAAKHAAAVMRAGDFTSSEAQRAAGCAAAKGTALQGGDLDAMVKSAFEAIELEGPSELSVVWLVAEAVAEAEEEQGKDQEETGLAASYAVRLCGGSSEEASAALQAAKKGHRESLMDSLKEMEKLILQTKEDAKKPGPLNVYDVNTM